MNKRDFKRYIKENLAGIPLEMQKEELDKMKNCIDEVKKQVGKKIVKKRQGKFCCSGCKKWISQKKFTTVTVREVRTQKVSWDAGYGDCEEIADITWDVTYYVCPECGQRREKDRKYVSETNRRNAYR